MIASGHDPLNGLSMLSGPHFVLEAIHCDLGAEELSILCNKIKKKVYLTWYKFVMSKFQITKINKFRKWATIVYICMKIKKTIQNR